MPAAPAMEENPRVVPAPAEKNQAAAEMGRRGGLKGGAMRAARMTPEERSTAARQAAAARWAKVAAERPSPKGEVQDETAETSGRTAKPFVFHLEPEEALLITEAKGSGGQQTLHRRLVAELAKGDLTITLNDSQFGELIRYMTRYGSGGFQGRLQAAFRRELADLLHMHPF